MPPEDVLEELRNVKRIDRDARNQRIIVSTDKDILPQLAPRLHGFGDAQLPLSRADQAISEKEILERCSGELLNYFSDIIEENAEDFRLKEGANPRKAGQLGRVLNRMIKASVPLPKSFVCSENFLELRLARKLDNRSIAEAIETGDLKNYYRYFFRPSKDELDSLNEQTMREKILEQEAIFQFTKGLKGEQTVESRLLTALVNSNEPAWTKFLDDFERPISDSFQLIYHALVDIPVPNRFKALYNAAGIDRHLHSPVEMIKEGADLGDVVWELVPQSGTKEQRLEIAKWSVGKQPFFGFESDVNEMVREVGPEHRFDIIKFLFRHSDYWQLGPEFTKRLPQLETLPVDDWSFEEKLELSFLVQEDSKIEKLVTVVNNLPQQDRLLALQFGAPSLDQEPKELQRSIEELLKRPNRELLADLLNKTEDRKNLAQKFLKDATSDPFELLSLPISNEALKLAHYRGISLEKASYIITLPREIQDIVTTLLSKTDYAQQIIQLVTTLKETPDHGKEALSALKDIPARNRDALFFEEFEQIENNVESYVAAIYDAADRSQRLLRGTLLCDRTKKMLPQLMLYCKLAWSRDFYIMFKGERGVDASGLSREALTLGALEISSYFSDILEEFDHKKQFKGGADPERTLLFGRLLHLMLDKGVPFPKQFLLNEELFQQSYDADQLAKPNLTSVIKEGDLKALYQKLFPDRAEYAADFEDEDLKDQILDQEPLFQFTKGITRDGRKPVSIEALVKLTPPADIRKLIFDNLVFREGVPAKSQEFLTKWLTEARDEELEKFLMLLSGTTTVPEGRKINIFFTELRDFYPHSCSLQLDIGETALPYDEWKMLFDQMLDDPEYSGA